MDISEIISVAQDIGFNDLTSALQRIDGQKQQADCPIVLPLVGEFSSGKTTLLNALTDSKKLETATKPTTATIYELHFGCDSCYANVIGANGESTRIENLEELSNATLSDALVVEVYDTSKRISPSTILVDTPGLSSPNIKHKQALVNFMPKADGIILVSDINQQITRSLTDFIETIKLSRRPIYLVLTKCDTKSAQDIEKAKEYICTNIKLPIGNIVCVSAVKEDLSELYSLLQNVQKEKSVILEKVNEQRVKQIVNELIGRIDDLLSNSFSDKDSENSIREKQLELNKMKRNIDKIVESLQGDIEDSTRKLLRDFEDRIFNQLESIAAAKSYNHDEEACSAINNLSSLLLNEYKSDIKNCFIRKSNEQNGSDNAINLRCLEDLDLSKYQINGIGYNLNLNELGHKYDGWISTGVKVAAAAAAVYAVASVASAAAAGSASTAAGAAGSAGTAAEGAAAVTGAEAAISVADTASDVGSIVSNHKTVNRIQKATSFVGQLNNQYDSINNREQMYAQATGASKGIVESMVGFVTDKAMGKPQRRRAIHQYIDETLLPALKAEASRISTGLITDIRNTLYQETNETTTNMVNAIQELKTIRETKQKEFEQRIEKMRDYKNKLITL